MTIQVEFEGGCVSYEGKSTGAVPVLKCLQDNGHDISFTTGKVGEELKEARQWFKDNDIHFICDNLNTRYVQMVINPKDVNAHLTKGYYDTNEPFIDWITVANILEIKGLITREQRIECENKIREKLIYE